MSDKDTKLTRISELALVLVTVFWGSSFVVARVALDSGMSPLFILLGRFLIGTAFMGAVLLWQRAPIKAAYVKPGIILGVIFFLGFITQLTGLQYTTPSNNAIITASAVVITPFISWMVTKRRPAAIMFIACVIALVGMVVVSVDFSYRFAFNYGDILTFISAIMFAGQFVAVEQFTRRINHYVLVFMQFAVAVSLSAVFFMFTGDAPVLQGNMSGIFAVVYLGVACTVICFLLQAWALKKVSATRSAIIFSLEAFFAVIIAVLVGLDVISWRVASGGLLIMLAISLPSLYVMMREYISNRRLP